MLLSYLTAATLRPANVGSEHANPDGSWKTLPPSWSGLLLGCLLGLLPAWAAAETPAHANNVEPEQDSPGDASLSAAAGAELVTMPSAATLFDLARQQGTAAACQQGSLPDHAWSLWHEPVAQSEEPGNTPAGEAILSLIDTLERSRVYSVQVTRLDCASAYADHTDDTPDSPLSRHTRHSANRADRISRKRSHEHFEPFRITGISHAAFRNGEYLLKGLDRDARRVDLFLPPAGYWQFSTGQVLQARINQRRPNRLRAVLPVQFVVNATNTGYGELILEQRQFHRGILMDLMRWTLPW